MNDDNSDYNSNSDPSQQVDNGQNRPGTANRSRPGTASSRPGTANRQAAPENGNQHHNHRQQQQQQQNVKLINLQIFVNLNIT